ncbi:MAG: SDR family oxidoreductase [Alphaproteobacteria bacterium]|nr:SDR family oxidoreductase [Alphaproteobacteria bacterium]
MAGRLEGRKAIVTGAASGIGRASARLFAAEGAKTLAVDLPGKGLAEAATGCEILEVSVADADAPERIVETARIRLGGLDILFNNAGVSGSTLVADLSDEEWDRQMAVNVRAVFRTCRAAIPLLIESQAGRIINTASVMAEHTNYGLAPYCASKAGVAGLTRTLALELGKYGVTANYLLPGAIRTGMTGPGWDARPDVEDIWAKKSVLRRIGQPEDLARAALFLASDDSAFVTGHGLNVDGGLGLRL